MINYIADITNEFLRCFDIMNIDKFDGLLVQPIITIQEGKKGTLGHCSVKKIWVMNDEDTNEKTPEEITSPTDNIEEADLTETNGVFYEINISAKYLDSEPTELLGVLLHEMVHLKNNMDGIKDCNGKKHNKKFKVLAEKVGFTCEKDDKVGYGYTLNTPELNDYFENTVKLDKSKFKYYRYIPSKPKKDEEKKTFISYVCPICNKEAKGEEGMVLRCAECDSDLVEKPKGKRGRKPTNEG